ncbi:zinc homeostasis factor 1 [Metarhizium guizhouense ARSEF 977]|uniref:Zinc homeostasis factor 1 n=1 Tax=Metarhizium guizhouense (strain ARSEF 977) TaxID=1276136 RepID=A0A0B4GQW3_METGA|nr:zinc homeostasis factor 1 [Metarhizium guizhouense ARSEF 977]
MASKMAWSKSTRIKVMIAIDTAFFLLELICGFLAHSLALTADAFHMLNDIISLAIGLWAVVAAQKATTDEFTFGWVRAEILGAFFNAVFLIALCVSIILEALTRFVEPPEINQPKLILIVGCAGLVSNLLGFVVLGGHGHSHGDEEDGHDHDHDHGHHDHEHSHVEENRPSDELRSAVADEDGIVGDVLPEVIAQRAVESPETARRIRFGDDTAARDDSTSQSRATPQARGRGRRRSSKSGHSRFHSIEDMSIHPASFRQDIIAASLAASSGAGFVADSDTSEDAPIGDLATDVNEESPLLVGDGKGNNGTINHSHSHSHSASHKRPRRDSSVHDGHNHTLPRKAGAKASGHNHADMGMNAMMLHVLGDALGNVGVIITALVIWLTDWPGKLYCDPAVSLLITAIILKTSIPLTRATARVLLQATPENICIQDIRQDIEGLPGVVSCHHIHVWQLSDTKVVASMHLQVAFPINEHSGEKYMQLAKRARKCLHGYGIHSATIQPEFCLDQQHRHAGDAAALRMDGGLDGTGENACLLDCIDDCRGQGCCPSGDASSKASSTRRSSDSIHGGDGH